MSTQHIQHQPVLLPAEQQEPYKAAVSYLMEMFAYQDRGQAVIFSLPDRRIKFFDIAEPAWEVMAAQAAMKIRSTQHTYAGVCSLRTIPASGGRGSEADTQAMPGLWADIDVRGPAHSGVALPDTFDDAHGIIASVPLKPTMVVNSGYGLQAYWLFREPLILETTEDQQYGKGLAVSLGAYLNAFAARSGWKLDTVGDLARVLRVPGTYNHKIADDPKLVTVEFTDGRPRYNPSEFVEFLEYAPASVSFSRKSATTRAITDADFGAIMQGCSWMRHAVEHAATLPEPEWYHAISIAGSCREGRENAHLMSQPYPGYTREETDKKFDHALGVPPSTCDRIAQYFDAAGEYCGKCQHRGTINSPVRLGIGLAKIAEHHGLDALMARHDLAAIFDAAPKLAKLSVTEWMVTREKLRQNFGKTLKLSSLDAAVKAERIKLREENRKTATDNGLPQIIVSNKPLRVKTHEALEAVRLRNDPPHVFTRAGKIVRVIQDEQGRPFIQTADDHTIRGILTRSADYLEAKKDSDVHVSPPMDVVEDIASLPSDVLGFPSLTGIVETPTLRPDGTIISEPGYDAATGMYYIPPPGLQVPEIPEHPTVDDVEGAVALLEEAVCDFPFEDQASKANFFGLTLTPIVRTAYEGCTPLATVDAPQAGSGKSLMVSLSSIITTGRNAPMMPYPHDDEEMAKQISSSLRAGRPIVCFDNLEGALDSPALAMGLTSREYEARILGRTENMLVPNNAVWMVTGNNIKPGGDMPRRCYHIRLNAKSSKPFLGRKFKHSNLLKWATDNRPRLIHALLTIARYWYVCGKPQRVDNPLGSFEEWHQTVGSMLATAGVAGFLGNFDKFSRTDDSVGEWEAFLGALSAHYGDEAFTAARVVLAIEQVMAVRNAVPLYLMEKMAAGRGPTAAQRAIGLAFSKRRDVCYGDDGLRLTRSDEGHTKMAVWHIFAGSAGS